MRFVKIYSIKFAERDSPDSSLPEAFDGSDVGYVGAEEGSGGGEGGDQHGDEGVLQGGGHQELQLGGRGTVTGGSEQVISPFLVPNPRQYEGIISTWN